MKQADNFQNIFSSNFNNIVGELYRLTLTHIPTNSTRIKYTITTVMSPQ